MKMYNNHINKDKIIRFRIKHKSDEIDLLSRIKKKNEVFVNPTNKFIDGFKVWFSRLGVFGWMGFVIFCFLIFYIFVRLYVNKMNIVIGDPARNPFVDASIVLLLNLFRKFIVYQRREREPDGWF